MLIKRTCTFFLASLLSLQAFTADHKTRETTLSRGIEVLQAKACIVKTNLPGCAICFGQSDFDRHLGKWQYSSIKILSVPKKEMGTLMINGTEVKKGTVLTKKDLDHLILKPNTDEEYTSSFSFSSSESNQIYEFTVSYKNEETPYIEASHLEFNTYKNVTLQKKIKIKNDEKVIIEKNCRQGILNLDPESGIFTYSPKQNFLGTDCFYYTIFDSGGNYSETKVAFVHVEKAEQNLYFHDLSGEIIHKDAINLCSKGILPYELDEKGLPVFSKDKVLNANQIQEILSKANKIDKNISLDVSQIFQADPSVTKEECVLFLSNWIHQNSSDKS